MDADNKVNCHETCAEMLAAALCPQPSQGKEKPVLEKENEGRSVALRNDQITENELLLLSQKAKEMIECGTTPPAPKTRVKESKRVKIKK